MWFIPLFMRFIPLFMWFIPLFISFLPHPCDAFIHMEWSSPRTRLIFGCFSLFGMMYIKQPSNGWFMESFIIGFTMFTTLVWLINQQLVDDFYALDERLRKTYTNHHLLKPCLPLGVTTHLSVYRSLWLGWLINLVDHITWRAHIWQVERLAKQKQELKKEWNRAAWQSRCETIHFHLRLSSIPCIVFPRETTETKHVLEDDDVCSAAILILVHKNGSFPCWLPMAVAPSPHVKVMLCLAETHGRALSFMRPTGVDKEHKPRFLGTSGLLGKGPVILMKFNKFYIVLHSSIGDII